jgi:HSP20 family protein
MLRSHWNPMREMVEAQRHFSDFFGEALRLPARLHNSHHTWTPAVDVSETENAYIFTVDLPGMKPEQVTVEVKEQTLIVAGERATPAQTEAGRFHHRERPTGRFARAFRLSKPVDAADVTATYRDGILSVVVPLQATAKRRGIEVQG